MCDNTYENLDTHVLWLSCKLRNMSEDILQFAKFNGCGDVEASEAQYRKYMRDAVNFNAGAHICEKFLYGSIGLDTFCAEMLNDDLKEFLIDIPNLPQALVEKYNLVQDTSEDMVVVVEDSISGISYEEGVDAGAELDGHQPKKTRLNEN